MNQSLFSGFSVPVTAVQGKLIGFQAFGAEGSMPKAAARPGKEPHSWQSWMEVGVYFCLQKPAKGALLGPVALMWSLA